MKTKKDLVSIIVRTFNRPERLERTLESIFSQDYSPIEIIVVNDGGIDVSYIINHFKDLTNTSGLVRKIEYIVNKSRVFRASSANIGIEASNGEYIGFLDDDDYFLNDHISQHITAQTKNGNLLSISKAIESIEIKSDKDSFKEQEKRYYFPEKINKLYFYFFDNYFPFNSIIFNRKVINVIGNFDPKLYVLEDWDFFIRLVLNFDPKFINKTTCIYSTRNDKSNVRLSEKYKENWKEAYQTIREKYRKVYKNSQVSIPISEVTDFLTDYAIESYDLSKKYEALVNLRSYKLYKFIRKFLSPFLFFLK